MKNIDLAMSWKGGLPCIYDKNVMEYGDFKKIAFLVGSVQGELVDNGKYLLKMDSELNTPEYLKQVKAFLKDINNSISFANDQPNGSFLNPKSVLQKASELYKLMNFEKNLILEKKDILHKIYVSAIKSNKNPELPQEYDYLVMSGNLYPYRQVYSAVCALI